MQISVCCWSVDASHFESLQAHVRVGACPPQRHGEGPPAAATAATTARTQPGCQCCVPPRGPGGSARHGTANGFLKQSVSYLLERETPQGDSGGGFWWVGGLAPLDNSGSVPSGRNSQGFPSNLGVFGCVWGVFWACFGVCLGVCFGVCVGWAGGWFNPPRGLVRGWGLGKLRGFGPGLLNESVVMIPGPKIETIHGYLKD